MSSGSLVKMCQTAVGRDWKSYVVSIIMLWISKEVGIVPLHCVETAIVRVSKHVNLVSMLCGSQSSR